MHQRMTLVATTQRPSASYNSTWTSVGVASRTVTPVALRAEFGPTLSASAQLAASSSGVTNGANARTTISSPHRVV